MLGRRQPRRPPRPGVTVDSSLERPLEGLGEGLGHPPRRAGADDVPRGVEDVAEVVDPLAGILGQQTEIGDNEFPFGVGDAAGAGLVSIIPYPTSVPGLKFTAPLNAGYASEETLAHEGQMVVPARPSPTNRRIVEVRIELRQTRPSARGYVPPVVPHEPKGLC